MIEAIETGIGYDVILWFQSWRTDFVAAAFRAFDYVGTEGFFLLALPLLYWCVQKSFGRRMMLVFLFSTWLNTLCKNWWKRPRPYRVTVPGKTQATPAGLPQVSYGIPSGHTQAGTTFFGYMAMGVKRRWFTILAVFLILGMGISRMVHGMHYPQDVLVGWTLGLLCLGLVALLDKPVARWGSSAPVWQILTVISVLCAAMLGLFSVLDCDPRGWKTGITVVAALFGGGIGTLWEDRTIKFSASGSWQQRVLRFVVGIALAAVIYLGLNILFDLIIEAIYGTKDADLEFWSLALRFVRYTAVGLWVAGGAPALFLRLKLAEKEA